MESSGKVCALWAQDARSRLHSADAWAHDDGVGLTYCATGAGFAGRAELARFAAVHGASVLGGAAGADVRTLGVCVDAANATICEEVVLAIPHLSAMHWLAPGVAPTGKTLVVPAAISLRFDAESWRRCTSSASRPPAFPGAEHSVQAPLLRAARVYWDGAAVLTQLGVLRAVLEPRLRAGVSAETLATHLPLSDGARIAHRLVHGASPGNALWPLDAPAGLDGVSGMERALPLVPEHLLTPARRRTASVFDEQRAAPTPREVPRPGMESRGVAAALCASVNEPQTPCRTAYDASRFASSVFAPAAAADSDAAAGMGRRVNASHLETTAAVETPAGPGRRVNASHLETTAIATPAGVGRRVNASHLETTANETPAGPGRRVNASHLETTAHATPAGPGRRVNASHLETTAASEATTGTARKVNASHLVSSLGDVLGGGLAATAPEGSFSGGPAGRRVNASHLVSSADIAGGAAPPAAGAGRRVNVSHLKSSLSLGDAEEDESSFPLRTGTRTLGR